MKSATKSAKPSEDRAQVKRTKKRAKPNTKPGEDKAQLKSAKRSA